MKLVIELNMTRAEIEEHLAALLWHGEHGHASHPTRKIAKALREAKERAFAEQDKLISTLTFGPDNESS